MAESNKKPVELVAKDPSLQPGKLKQVGGSASDDWTIRRHLFQDTAELTGVH